MNNNHMHVTVKRIEKIPSQYYVQIPQTKVKANTKVAVEVDASLRANHKRLTHALKHRPAVKTDYSQGIFSFIKNGFSQAKAFSINCFSALSCYIIENAKRLLFSFVASGAVAAAACAILVSTCSLGYEITVSGQIIGTAQNKEAYEQLVTDINHEISYVGGEGFTPSATPEISLKLIPKGAFSDDADMREALKSTSQNMLPAYGVYVNEQVLFALPNEQSALNVLEDYKAQYTAGKENIQADFCETVTVSHRFVPKTALKTQTGAMNQLLTGRIVLHTLAEGDTPESVASHYQITVDDVLKLNSLSDFETPQTQLKICTEEPLLSVKTIERKTIEEEIPFTTIEKDDPTIYEGNLVVTQEGAPGSRMVEAYVTSVNGVETSREVLSESILSVAVDKIVKKGTKEPPSPVGTGRLSVPTSGALSSRFGSRWGRTHAGIDLSAAVGTNIYAADNGTVIYSDYNNGGYGYLIQLDHGNGIITYYGHCSELLVPEGAVVAKGDLIAKVGNTGRSTGPHLHFEVRVNGTPTDPMAYLKGLE
ncbi:MAG: M23 family metallopeptidase [Ruminococcaceae bacterium]|nr:M23 family metallopeptidase [Oscillospiraceae bacterium]